MVAVDLGYSAKQASCGLMHKGLAEPVALTFGELTSALIDALNHDAPCVLAIEAVLSTYHTPAGNPDIRCDAERGRGWYYGPGVSTFAGALRLLQQLTSQVHRQHPVYLAEAFLSFKKARTTHTSDALRIYREFHSVQVVAPCPGSQPILANIRGLPPILCFQPTTT